MTVAPKDENRCEPKAGTAPATAAGTVPAAGGFAASAGDAAPPAAGDAAPAAEDAAPAAGSRESRAGDRESTAGGAVNGALNKIVRWASRGDVRRRLLGPGGHDLSPTDTWLLAAIDERGPVRVSDLAAWQGVDKSTMTPQVRRLEDRGLVGRQQDLSDRRAVLITISPQGRRMRRRMATAGARVMDDLLSGWSEDDRDTLARLVSRFAAELEQRRLR